MLNIELLRKVQKSIADPENPFDMGDWGFCICGHAYVALTGKKLRPHSVDPYNILAVFGAIGLTSGNWLTAMHAWDRSQAIAAIDHLIDADEAQIPAGQIEERELACV